MRFSTLRAILPLLLVLVCVPPARAGEKLLPIVMKLDGLR